MKTTLFALLMLLALPALADSIPLTTINLTGVGSGQNGTQFWSSDPAPKLFYSLNTTAGAGYMEIEVGKNTFIFAGVSNGQLSGGVFSATFTGIEATKLGPQDWVYWTIGGTLTETVDFHAADGVGTVSITSSEFQGTYPTVPEPGTWALLLTGALPIWSLWRRRASS